MSYIVHTIKYILIFVLLDLYIILGLYYYIIQTIKFLKVLLQKRNDNYFGFEVLCHLKNKLLSKLLQKNSLYLYLSLCLAKKA